MVLVLLCMRGCAAANIVHGDIYAQQSITQVSTINAILSGVYDGVFKCAQTGKNPIPRLWRL